jgi:hypothetical protein
MLGVLPDLFGLHSLPHEPQFRDWKPARSPIKMADSLRFVTETVARLLDDAATTEDWVALLDKLSQLPLDDRQHVRETLVSRLEDEAFQTVDLSQLWEAVRALTAHHRQHADTATPLAEEELQHLEALEARLRPSQPMVNSAWLFANQMPDLEEHRPADDLHRYEEELAQRRQLAMGEILRRGGMSDARLLAKSSPVPWSVDVAIADATADEFESELLTLLEADDSADIQIAHGYAARRFVREGWAWIQRLTEDTSSLGAGQKARLLIATQDYPRAWEVAEGLGKTVRTEFWKRFMPYRLVQRAVCALAAHQHHQDAPAVGVLRLRVIPVLDQLEQEPAAVLPHGLADHALLAEREVLILPGRQMGTDEAPGPVTQQGPSAAAREAGSVPLICAQPPEVDEDRPDVRLVEHLHFSTAEGIRRCLLER